MDPRQDRCYAGCDAAVGFVSGDVFQNGLRAPAQCGNPYAMDKFQHDVEEQQKHGCLFVTTGQCDTSEADREMLGLEVSRGVGGEVAVAAADLAAGTITQAEYETITGGLLSEYESRSTAGGTCIITGCKTPFALDAATGAVVDLWVFP